MFGVTYQALFLCLVTLFGQSNGQFCLGKVTNEVNFLVAQILASDSIPEISFNHFIDNCMPTLTEAEELAEDVNQLTATNSDCHECPIDEGNCWFWWWRPNTTPVARFGFDSSIGMCRAFTFKGCSIGNANRFESMEECQTSCESPCDQPMDVGEDCSDSTSGGTAFYFNKATNQCSSFEFKGCAGNKNKFATEDQCKTTCIPEVSRSVKTNTGGAVAQSVVNRMSDEAQAECTRLRSTYTWLEGAIKFIDRSASPALVARIQAALKAKIAIEEALSSRALFEVGGILYWATVRKFTSDTCKKIHITIRINCRPSLFYNPDSNFETLCTSALAGIKKHWERTSITEGTTVWPVEVEVQRTPWFSKRMILWFIPSAPSIGFVERSYNPGLPFLAMNVKFLDYATNKDLDFQYTAAHELGHDVLMAGAGLVWSWGHEGTTTILGARIPGVTPAFLPTGEINLMHYFTNAFAVADYSRIIATEDQVQTLVSKASVILNLPTCPCSQDSDCSANSCHWTGLCQDCQINSDCATATEYCDSVLFNALPSRCKALKANGNICGSNEQCLSGDCRLFTCRAESSEECSSHSDCSADQYCRNLNLAFLANSCTAKKCRGFCAFDNNRCLSGVCRGWWCRRC